ncbi:UNVERIFIED_CONTAM: hypothetical protein RMT77_016376 [Armadillidium vulgare]|nr:Tumor suppressor candidate 2 [Armadillidium vulgare]
MGGSTSKLKRWIGRGEDEDDQENNERAVKRLASPFIYTRQGSMYFDQDGDLAHEFYIEVPSKRQGIKTKMKRMLDGLTPQGEIKLPFPCLHVDFPIIMYQDT